MIFKFILFFSLFCICFGDESFYIRNVIKEKKVTNIPFKVTKPIIKRSRNFSVRPVVKEIKEEEKIFIVTKPIIKKFKFGLTTPMITTSTTIKPNIKEEYKNNTEEYKNNTEEYKNNTEEYKNNTEEYNTEDNNTEDNNTEDNNVEEDIRYNNLNINMLKKTLNDCKYKFYDENTENNIDNILSFFNDENEYSNYHYSIKIIENYLPYFNENKNNIQNINKKMYTIKNNYNKINNITKNDINIGIRTVRENFGTYLCSKIFKTLKGYENILNLKIFSKMYTTSPVCHIFFSSFVLPNKNLDEFQTVVLQQVVIPLEHLPAYQICNNGKINITC